jgi:hypothetical protein
MDRIERTGGMGRIERTDGVGGIERTDGVGRIERTDGVGLNEMIERGVLPTRMVGNTAPTEKRGTQTVTAEGEWVMPVSTFQMAANPVDDQKSSQANGRAYHWKP